MKLSPVQYSHARETALAEGLEKLATRYGKRFRQARYIDSRGEFSLNIADPAGMPRDESQAYGVEMSALLSKYRPRTGYAPTAHMDPSNSWCYMNHFDVEKMLTDEGLYTPPPYEIA